MTKKLFFGYAILACFGLVFSFEGCYYDNAEELYPVDTVIVMGTTNWSTLSSTFETKCANQFCHASGNSNGRQPLSSYSEVVAAIESHDLRRRVDAGSMPPSGLPDDEKELILEWIDNGYVEQ